MEVNEVDIKFKSRSDWFYVVPIGDIHLGNACCDIEKCKEMVNWIKEHDNVWWIGMGDYVDCVNYSDKRFDPSTVDKKYLDNLSNAVPRQIEDVIELLGPIADKCLGLHRGNHEETIRLRYHYDVMYEMWKAFNVPMLKDSAITRLHFNDGKGHRAAFDIFSTHGSAGGRKGGGKINRLEDMIGFYDADVYLMGHSHIKETETKSTIYVDNQMNLKVRKRILAVTGCFLNGYQEGVSSYVEKWGFPPTDTGVVKLMFNPRKKDIHISE
jgi:hypothetical protein